MRNLSSMRASKRIIPPSESARRRARPVAVLSHPSSPTGVCDKNTPPEKKTLWKIRLAKHQIRGWRAVSASGLQGEGSRKRNVFFTGTGSTHQRGLRSVLATSPAPLDPASPSRGGASVLRPPRANQGRLRPISLLRLSLVGSKLSGNPLWT